MPTHRHTPWVGLCLVPTLIGLVGLVLGIRCFGPNRVFQDGARATIEAHLVGVPKPKAGEQSLRKVVDQAIKDNNQAALAGDGPGAQEPNRRDTYAPLFGDFWPRFADFSSSHTCPIGKGHSSQLALRLLVLSLPILLGCLVVMVRRGGGGGEGLS